MRGGYGRDLGSANPAMVLRAAAVVVTTSKYRWRSHEFIRTISIVIMEYIARDSAAELSPQWFAVYTSSCQEKRVGLHLSARSIDHFLPLTRSGRRWKNGLNVVLEQPLFPGYVFVRIDRRERLRVLELPGVLSIVGTGREPTALPTEEIEALREGIGLRSAKPHPFLNLGEKARIARGPLQGMTGVVTRQKGGLRLILSLDLIMKSISVEVDASDLEPAVAASQTLQGIYRSAAWQYDYGTLEKRTC
jgi:transcription termination/antitermination protein NusG